MKLKDERSIMMMGNTFVVSFPQSFAEIMKLNKGDKVILIMTEEDRFIVKKK